MHNNWGWSYSWFSAHDEVRRKGAPPAGPEDKFWAWLVITFVLGAVAMAMFSSGNGGGAVLGMMAVLVIVKATIDLFK